MNTKTKKPVEKTAKKKDIVENNNTDTVNETKPDAAVEVKPDAVPKSKSLIIKVEDLVPFKDHPYLVREGVELDDLTESVAEQGILSPLLVRPLEEAEGKYEIISGHRRYAAARKLSLKKVPCTVHFIDRDAATVMMVDSNCQRTELLPSEKAKAYKMKYDALSHQGTSRQVGAKSRTSEEIAENADDSARQIQRYIRLTNLIPELMDMMDENKIAFSVGVELSFLSDQLQTVVLDACKLNDNTPSYAQAVRMHKAHTAGTLDRDGVYAVMCEEKANQREKLTISLDRLKGKIPEDYSVQQQQDFVVKAVDHYYRYLQKQREMSR